MTGSVTIGGVSLCDVCVNIYDVCVSLCDVCVSIYDVCVSLCDVCVWA